MREAQYIDLQKRERGCRRINCPRRKSFPFQHCDGLNQDAVQEHKEGHSSRTQDELKRE